MRCKWKMFSVSFFTFREQHFKLATCVAVQKRLATWPKRFSKFHVSFLRKFEKKLTEGLQLILKNFEKLKRELISKAFFRFLKRKK